MSTTTRAGSKLLLNTTLLLALWSAPAGEAFAKLTFACEPDNDLYLALGRERGRRFDSPLQAVRQAQPGSAVLILANGYPDRTTEVDPAVLAAGREKRLRLFIEFPGSLPGLEVGAPRTASWERIVVSSEAFGPALPKMRVLSAHECRYVPVSGADVADLSLARVAGYDRAVFGLPEKGVFPILFRMPEHGLIVAATRLSNFVTGRYAPAGDWVLVWERILAELDAGRTHRLRWEPVVWPAYGPTARLPARYQRDAFNAAARWLGKSGLLVSPAEKETLYGELKRNGETTDPASTGTPRGDGSLGILEGYASGIRTDGQQARRLPLRADCNLESAMVFALNGSLNREPAGRVIASNLLDFVYFNSGLCQGGRADPRHGAYGLIGWGDVSPVWLVANYGDDNARAMLATAIAGACLKSDRWDEVLMRALLANLRTTGKLGFRGDRIDMPALERNGWQAYFDGSPVNYSPHFESYLWACHLWAYRHTQFEPFLERSRTAIAMTMKAYPDQWRWQDNLERAHMLLCLAWLVRIEDTEEHRGWLRRVAGDLLEHQQPSGAIYERLGRPRGGHYGTPQRNEDYGTGETPLLQENGDPVSDQLYTTGFALLGLHEAAAATGDANLRRAEDRLAEYLCRIQTRSKRLPHLSGTWFRAFDGGRWEPWASSADVGWGAWSIESGWGQAWTAAVLGLRERGTTVWELTVSSGVGRHFARLRGQMLPAEAR